MIYNQRVTWTAFAILAMFFSHLWQLACLTMNKSAFKNQEDDAAIKIKKSNEFLRNAGKEWWNDLGWMLTKGQGCFEQRWRWARRGGGSWSRVVHGTRSSHHHQSAQTIRHTCPPVVPPSGISDWYSERNFIVRTLFVFICIRQFVTGHQQSPTRLLCGRMKISSPTR